MAKKCKDCDPNKYIEGLAYRGANGYSFDGYLNYNDVGQPYDSEGKPTTDMLANVQDMLDAYNPIFSTNSTVGLPPSVNNGISIRGIDSYQGFWFIWNFVDGLISYANPGYGATYPAILSAGQTTSRYGTLFVFNIVTDQIPSALSYSGFDKFADKQITDTLKFDLITSTTTALRKNKVNYVGYHTGYIKSTANYANTSYSSRKTLTIKSLSSDVRNPVYNTEPAASYIKLAMPLTIQPGFIDLSSFISGGSSIPKTVTSGNTIIAATKPANQNNYLGAAYLDGNDRLRLDASNDFNFGTGNFTIEWWQNWKTLAGHQAIISNNYVTSPGLTLITDNGTGKYRVFVGNTQIFAETTASTVGQWHHYALVRNGTTITLYRDGSSNGSATTSAAAGNGSAPFDIGAANNLYYINGYLQDFKVYKGYAKYIGSNFNLGIQPRIILTEGSGGEIIEVTSAPTLAALKTQTVNYKLTTNLGDAYFTATLEEQYITILRNLGLTYNSSTKTISGLVSSLLADEIKNTSIIFNVRANKDADAGNAQSFTLNIIYGKYDASAANPTVTNYETYWNWPVGTYNYYYIQGLNGGTKIVGVSNLPEGFSFNSSGNYISGTPVHAGRFTVYVSTSNAKGDSATAIYIINTHPFEETNTPSGVSRPSEVKILQNSYNVLKNNKITLRLNAQQDASGFLSRDVPTIKFKKINTSEYTYIKTNGKPNPYTGTYSRSSDGIVSVTINNATKHGFGAVGTSVSLLITANSGGLSSGERFCSITGENTFSYQDSVTGAISGTLTVESYIIGYNITEIFSPGIDRNSETSFWIYVQDANLRLGANRINIGGSYDIDYSLPSIIDALGNSCFSPSTDSDGPVSTPTTVSLDVTASNCIKNSISANPIENLPSISLSPAPDVEHQVVFSSLVLAESNITSATASTITTTSNIATSINQWQNLDVTVEYYTITLGGTPFGMPQQLQKYSFKSKILSNTLNTITIQETFPYVSINSYGNSECTITYPLETASNVANEKLSKTGLLKYPYGLPAGNGTYYFYIIFTDTCAFNNVYSLFTLFINTYTPRIGDVYSCYYWYTPAPPRRYGKGRCFPAGTKIYTPEGNIDIKDIKVDQEVYAFDEDRNLVKSRVVAFLDHDLVPDKIYKITLENDQYIRANHEHPFLNGDGDFVSVSMLKVGDELVTFHDKKLKIISIEEDGYEPVYNIEVEKYHTYIAENLFVHNIGGYTRPRQVKGYRNETLTSSNVPSNCDGGIVSRVGSSVTYKDYGFQYRNTLLESKDVGITSLTNISMLDVLGEGPIEGIVDYEIKPKPGFKKGDIGYLNGVDLVRYPGENAFIRSIFWNETALADDTYPNPGSVNFEFIKLKFDSADSAPRHTDINKLSEIKLEEEFYSKKVLNGAYVNYTTVRDQYGRVISNNIKLPRRLTSTKTVGTKLNGKRVFQDGTERTYKKSINILTKDLYALKLHIKAVSLFKQIVDLSIFDSASEAEENSVGGRIDRQSMTFNLTLKRVDKGSGSEGLVTTAVDVGGGKTSLPLVITGRLNSGPYIETFEWSGLNKISNKNTIGWEIEIEPTYIESIDANIVLKSSIDSITEVYNEYLALPHTAGVMTTFDARFFTNIPQRAYDVRMLKVKIPSNYNPFSKTYDGVWDGRFKLSWTDNPAWCFYDLLTNRRYGLGKYVDPQFTDKWTLYEIGKYCDELVNDGRGGLEPRFTANVLISTREDAYKVVNDMASIFRAIVYYNAGLIMASQDRPKEPIYLFNNSNVKDGEFTYSNTSKRVRRNVALVRYNDKDNFYKPAVKYVENREGLIRYGIRETEVSAFGCTSEGQAERLGKWTLLSENFESELVSFETTLPGMYLKPGDIILVQDQNRQNKVLGGRTYELNKDSAILDVKYENISGFLPAISGCKFNILTPAGNIDLSVGSGELPNTVEFANSNFSSYGGSVYSGLSPSIIRKKQIQTIDYTDITGGTNINPFSMYVSLETGENYDGYTRINFGGQLLDDKDHTLLQNTVWTIELDPLNYNYQVSPSVSGFSNTGLYPGAYLEPYIDKTQRFRVLDIEEQEEYRYKITALQYDETKYSIGDDI